MLRIQKRTNMPFEKRLLVRVLAILAALLLDGLIIFFLTKMNPLSVYATMFTGVFGMSGRIWNAVKEIMMLLCIGVGLAPAFKMKFWNIGAEGQVLVGGLAAALLMKYIPNAPLTVLSWIFGNSPGTLASLRGPSNAILLILMFIAAITAGGLWGFIPAISKAKLNTNETLFTLMMNYIAIQLVSFFVTFMEKSYGSGTVGILNGDTQMGWFPAIAGQKYLLNVIIVMAVTVLMFFYLRYTKHGYEIAVVGESHNTAKYAGINVGAVTIRTVTLSGAICGLAGFISVAGAGHTISTSTAGGRGFLAIIVAWLAKFNTFVMILISFLLVFLEMGANEIVSKFPVINEFLSKIIIGVILFFILGSEFFINYRLAFTKAEKEIRAEELPEENKAGKTEAAPAEERN